jgi:hypothetical protein
MGTLKRRVEDLEARTRPDREPLRIVIVYVSPDGTKTEGETITLAPPAWRGGRPCVIDGEACENPVPAVPSRTPPR